MLYRIYTEDKNRETIVSIVSRWFDGFTLIETTGYYKGVKEKGLIIEVISEEPADILKVQAIEQSIIRENGQECVLTVKAAETSNLIYAA